MKKLLNRLGSTGGWTFLEMMVAMAIMAILAGIASASYAVLQARIRFSQMRANMDAIAMAGYTDYTTNSAWAPFDTSLPPSFVTSNSLKKWPVAPCPNWSYNWENWSDIAGADIAHVIRVTMRNDLTNTAIWSYCVDNIGGSGNCMFQDPFSTHTPMDITAPPQKYVYCSEQ